jgi:hypothetical protein
MNNENFIIDESDIEISKNNNFWVYVLTEVQYNYLCKNFDKDNTYISAYENKNIVKDDIIIFYIKRKGKKNGFIGISNVLTDMKENNKYNIFKDKNLNKYYTELDSILLLDDVYNIKLFDDIIKDNMNISFKAFARRYLCGECSLNTIDSNVGYFITKKINEMLVEVDEFNTKIEENTSIITDEEIENINEIEYVEDIKTNIINKKENNKLVSNIPILLLTCDMLKNNLILCDDEKDKISLILKHYKYCDKCDITNNNSRELHMTLFQKDIEITYTDDEYMDTLLAYISLENYPLNVDNNYIKLYYLTDDEDYRDDILIEFTSRIEVLDDNLLENNKVIHVKKKD